MIARNITLRRKIMLATLMIAVAALPFSVKLCHTAIILFIACWLFEGGWTTKLSIIQNSLILQLIIAMVLIQTGGLLFSDNILRGWFSLEKKIFFLLLPIALATTAVRFSRPEVKLVLNTFIATCFAGTIVCVAHAWMQTSELPSGGASVNQYLAGSLYSNLHEGASSHWLSFSYVSLSDGIGIHPTYFSLYLMFTIVLLLNDFTAASTLNKAVIVALVAYASLFVVFLAARIMIIAMFIVFVFVLVRCALERQKAVALVMVVGSILGSLLFLNPVAKYRNLEEVKFSTFQIAPGNHYTTAAQIRVSLWWLAIETAQRSNPFLGAGTGDVGKVMAITSDQLNVTNAIKSHDPHNQFLYALLSNGLPLLVILVLTMALPVWLSWIQRDYLVLGFMGLFSMVCLTESALELQKGIVFYSLMSGLLFFHLNAFQHVTFNRKSLLRVGE